VRASSRPYRLQRSEPDPSGFVTAAGTFSDIWYPFKEYVILPDIGVEHLDDLAPNGVSANHPVWTIVAVAVSLGTHEACALTSLLDLVRDSNGEIGVGKTSNVMSHPPPRPSAADIGAEANLTTGKLANGTVLLVPSTISCVDAEL
jgi:hypothetical protein